MGACPSKPRCLGLCALGGLAFIALRRISRSRAQALHWEPQHEMDDEIRASYPLSAVIEMLLLPARQSDRANDLVKALEGVQVRLEESDWLEANAAMAQTLSDEVLYFSTELFPDIRPGTHAFNSCWGRILEDCAEGKLHSPVPMHLVRAHKAYLTSEFQALLESYSLFGLA
mmetsp:Transcript_15422/g.32180  ORF Transcript_15422/g.32180 Transcript_15422/m.32180 type:complete len:172 (-) Transcript_15422:224-739(-)